MSASAGALARTHSPAGLGPLDASRSPALTRELPGLSTALDPDAMVTHLSRLFLGGSTRHTIDRCRPGHATYLPGGGCLVRYELTITGWGPTLVNGRLFRSPAACSRHLHDRLAPLAIRAPGRALRGPFIARVSAVEDLHLAVSRFPIDGELPALIHAADPVMAGRVLRRALGSRRGRCRVALGHYGRRNRCVLVYELQGASTHPERIYGKVSVDGRGATADAVIAALHARLPHRPEGARVTVPRSLGFHPAMGLLLLESVPGSPRLSSLLKAMSGARSGSAAIERAVEGCAEVAAALHTSGVTLGPRRSIGRDLAQLGEAAEGVRRIAPPLGAWLNASLTEVEERLIGSRALPACLCHGDFRHSQILFEGDRRALLDFDTVCQAEPALDLGHFLAYLRLSAAKRPALAHDVVDDLAERFVAAYLAAGGSPGSTPAAVRARVSAFEAVALVRLAVHSWQKFKPERLAIVITLLEERLSCLNP